MTSLINYSGKATRQETTPNIERKGGCRTVTLRGEAVLTRLSHWSAIAMLAAALFLAGILMSAQRALAAQCLVDGAGGGTDGPLCCNEHHYLALAYINESEWTGNLAYVAKRFDGDFNETYHVYVSSGPHSYGTSGNVWRRTAIQRGGYTNMSTWYVLERQLC